MNRYGYYLGTVMQNIIIINPYRLTFEKSCERLS